ncbi:unnamed protein product [Candidula unifasciata]|uniref:Uncharacterized protein n=1 Tax=Candidula unifasciata TaxID=100452 RepID=A0A8S3YX04_9EUPU|nr:unnamed protein product [Candidula unifasciata]
MKLRMEYLVLVLSFVCTEAGRKKYNCRHMPLPRYGDDIAELEIPPQCFGGVIIWRYPAGYLHLMSEKLAGYSLCIQENWKTWMGNLRVVSIHGLQQIPVPLPGA